MYTISDLRKLLGLETANQVRNRISAIRSILSGSLRHGPNNQILLTKEGLALLRQLQELYDSGLTLHEASDVIRHTVKGETRSEMQPESRLARNPIKREQQEQVIAILRDEIAFLRERVAVLEGRSAVVDRLEHSNAWWEEIKHESELA